MKNPVWDETLEGQLHFEAEQVHVITALYGVASGNSEKPEHLSIAKSLELMKAATLVLDDFLDKSDTRNGLPSVYSCRGAEETVLIADILRSSALIEFCRAVEGLGHPEAVSTAICLFEETYRTICIGQLEDMQLERGALSPGKPTETDYFTMIQHTSGVFIQLPLVLGALLANRSRQQLESLGRYGLQIGLAYQVRDDILDVIASPALTGKPAAGDIRNGKKRLPLIRLRDACHGNDQKKLMAIINNDRKPLPDARVQEVVALMGKYGTIDSCMATVESLCADALDSVKAFSGEQIFDQLVSIAALLTDFSCLSEADSAS